MLHKMMDGRLFRVDRAKGESVQSLAAEEATKAKKCIGALRYLWRNAKSCSHHAGVQAMKDLLVSSPQQEANQRAAQEASDSEAGDEEGEDDNEPSEASQHEDGEEQPEVPSDGEPEQGEYVMDEQGVSDDGRDDNDSLHAPTLRLGEESQSDATSEESGSDRGDDEHGDQEGFADSQVKPEGWLGGFYTKCKTAYGLSDADLKDTSKPTMNPALPYLSDVQRRMYESKALTSAIQGISPTMRSDGFRELALALCDVHSDLVAQDESLVE